ncbi:eukaryotic translation initiation factor 4E type 1B isoform X2 [Myiozetetes cayanensis]|uniref:eukaryotic translation initiation factor 4E type 1B isoform X2 n=1 Tax=Myiozetetes cayanensis TaxID=478635 RepID=UPI00215EBDE5|nr:eukaryotic translation initiation factor 4E type 1B isoform X2 [Myiozetetes cayanensis]
MCWAGWLQGSRGRRSGAGAGLGSKSYSQKRSWTSTPCRTDGHCGFSRMTRARCGRQTCASSPNSALWRTSGRCTATSSPPASSHLAVTIPSSRMASSPCGRTARTSVVGAGLSPCPSSSGTPSWTVSGWIRDCPGLLSSWQLLCLIGEMFDEYSDEVCGAVINIRTKGDKIAIWTREAENQEGVTHIGRVYKEHLGLSQKVTIGYQAHADTATKSNSLPNTKFVL